jgi:hypothetical protein
MAKKKMTMVAPRAPEPGKPMSVEEFRRQAIEQYERLFAPRESEKQNGLYVWLAIAESRMAAVPMPDWCLDYIHQAAGAIFWDWQKTRLTKPSDPNEVCYAIKHLKLSADGWNAFRQAKADFAKVEDAGRWESAEAQVGTTLEPILSREWAVQLIMKARGLTETNDDRQAMRRVREGKKLLHPNGKTKPKLR